MPFTYKPRLFASPVKRLFEYHCLESEDSSDAELWHRTHQRVTVLGVQFSEETPILSVQFADGFEGGVFIDELVKSTNEYYRPDYEQEPTDD